MPRIRQYSERDEVNDFCAEIKAQCARYGLNSRETIGKALGISPGTVGNYLRDPLNIRFGTLRTMKRVLRLNPEVILKALGYTTQDIRKLAKEYIQ